MYNLKKENKYNNFSTFILYFFIFLFLYSIINLHDYLVTIKNFKVNAVQPMQEIETLSRNAIIIVKFIFKIDPGFGNLLFSARIKKLTIVKMNTQE